jgi:hypothetical protein
LRGWTHHVLFDETSEFLEINRIFVLYRKSLLVDIRLHVPRKRRPVAHDGPTQTPNDMILIAYRWRNKCLRGHVCSMLCVKPSTGHGGARGAPSAPRKADDHVAVGTGVWGSLPDGRPLLDPRSLADLDAAVVAEDEHSPTVD